MLPVLFLLLGATCVQGLYSPSSPVIQLDTRLFPFHVDDYLCIDLNVKNKNVARPNKHNFVVCAGACLMFLISSRFLCCVCTSNFKKKVLDSDGVWMIEFYAPWCGHCKNLVSEWEQAAGAMKGIVSIAAVDATTEERFDLKTCDYFLVTRKRFSYTATGIRAQFSLASQYQIQGFPTIKVNNGHAYMRCQTVSLHPFFAAGVRKRQERSV
jgi:thiol-disulfide isomerase/thioredoxin